MHADAWRSHERRRFDVDNHGAIVLRDYLARGSHAGDLDHDFPHIALLTLDMATRRGELHSASSASPNASLRGSPLNRASQPSLAPIRCNAACRMTATPYCAVRVGAYFCGSATSPHRYSSSTLMSAGHGPGHA